MLEVPGVKAQDLKVFMRQAELTLEQKGLWCLILTWADQDGTNAFPTQETLSQISGRKIGWVKKHLKILEDKGYLKVTKEKRKGARYLHNVYSLKTRSTHVNPYGSTRVNLTKSLNQNSDSLSVESEAILRVVPRAEEETEKYGLQA